MIAEKDRKTSTGMCQNIHSMDTIFLVANIHRSSAGMFCPGNFAHPGRRRFPRQRSDLRCGCFLMPQSHGPSMGDGCYKASIRIFLVKLGRCYFYLCLLLGWKVEHTQFENQYGLVSFQGNNTYLQVWGESCRSPIQWILEKGDARKDRKAESPSSNGKTSIYCIFFWGTPLLTIQ